MRLRNNPILITEDVLLQHIQKLEMPNIAKFEKIRVTSSSFITARTVLFSIETVSLTLFRKLADKEIEQSTPITLQIRNFTEHGFILSTIFFSQSTSASFSKGLHKI